MQTQVSVMVGVLLALNGCGLLGSKTPMAKNVVKVVSEVVTILRNLDSNLLDAKAEEIARDLEKRKSEFQRRCEESELPSPTCAEDAMLEEGKMLIVEYALKGGYFQRRELLNAAAKDVDAMRALLETEAPDMNRVREVAASYFVAAKAVLVSFRGHGMNVPPVVDAMLATAAGLLRMGLPTACKPPAPKDAGTAALVAP